MELKKVLAVLLAIGLMGAFQCASAQDDGLDLLDAIEQEAPQSSSGDTALDLLDNLEAESTAKPRSPWVEVPMKLVDNFAGSVRLRYMHYLRGVEERDNADLSNDHFNYLFKFNSWTAAEAWRFDFAGWAEGGNEAGLYAGYPRWFQDDAGRNERRHIEINEVYATLYQNDFDVTLGRKIFNNGLSVLYSPANRLRPQDAIDPFDPKDFGLWQARVDYYLDKYTLTGAVFPVFDAGKSPPQNSRWIGSQKPGEDGRDFEHYNQGEIEEDYPEIEVDSIGYFGRAKTTYRGWDVFLSVYTGLNPYSVIKEEKRNGQTTKVKKYVRVGNYAAGFSTTWKKWEFHGEALYNHSYEGKDDNYFNLAAGFTYSFDDLAKKLFMEKIDVTVDYGKEWEIRAQYAPNYVESSSKSRIGRNDIFTRVNLKYNDDLDFTYLSNFEFLNGGRYNRFEGEYKFNPNWSARLAAETFNGDNESYYGRWWRNDRIISEVKYKF